MCMTCSSFGMSVRVANEKYRLGSNRVRRRSQYRSPRSRRARVGTRSVRVGIFATDFQDEPVRRVVRGRQRLVSGKHVKQTPTNDKRFSGYWIFDAFLAPFQTRAIPADRCWCKDKTAGGPTSVWCLGASAAARWAYPACTPKSPRTWNGSRWTRKTWSDRRGAPSIRCTQRRFIEYPMNDL